MANLLINQLPVITGNVLDPASVFLPIQGLISTNSILAKDLLQASIVSNKDLANKCNALARRLEILEPKPIHLIINQYYGGAIKIDTGSVSHAFIELYNPTDATIELAGKSVSYFFGSTIEKLDLVGSIPANHSFLIRCKLTNDSSLGTIPNLDLTDKDADMEWDIFLNNKSITIALMNSVDTIEAGVNPSTLDSYIDMIGSQDDKNVKPPFYEMAPANDQSKQKSIRRILFSDSDNNAIDCEIVDFRLEENLVKAPRCLADGAFVVKNLG